MLTDRTNANRYWADLKGKLAQEAGSEQPYENVVRLKLTAPEGKKREPDCATAETSLRVVQSVPSPKVGYERMQEMANPPCRSPTLSYRTGSQRAAPVNTQPPIG